MGLCTSQAVTWLYMCIHLLPKNEEEKESLSPVLFSVPKWLEYFFSKLRRPRFQASSARVGVD